MSSPNAGRTPAAGCHGRNVRGEPCGMAALAGEEYCFAHAPTRTAERAAARQRGGRMRQRAVYGTEPVALSTAAEVRAVLERAVSDTYALENSAQRSRALGGLLLVALRLLDVGDLQTRLAELEAAVAALNGSGPRRVA